jgi:hypothetical protein
VVLSLVFGSASDDSGIDGATNEQGKRVKDYCNNLNIP